MSPAKKKARCDKIEESVMTSEDPSSGFIRFETNVSNITTKGIYSPAIEVHDLSWKLLVKKGGTPSFLCVYLEHRESDCDMWSVHASGAVRLLNADNPSRRFDISVTYEHDKAAWGTDKLCDWGSLVDENKGFIKDGKIVIECKFTLSKFVGIRVNPHIDFSTSDDPRHDVALVIEGKKVYASKQILAVHSPVFNAMFYGEFAEKNKSEIELNEIVHKEFIGLLNLIYPSYEKITDSKIHYLLKLADRFQIKKITDQVEQFVIDSKSLSICSKLKLSEDYRLVKLQEDCLDSLESIEEITDLKTADGYKDLSKNMLGTLMKKVMKLS